MDNYNDKLEEIYRRAGIIKKAAVFRKRAAYSGISCAVCTVILTGVILALPNNTASTPNAFVENYGSLILCAPYMGYVVIAAVSFLIGVLFALMCINIREARKCTMK